MASFRGVTRRRDYTGLTDSVEEGGLDVHELSPTPWYQRNTIRALLVIGAVVLVACIILAIVIPRKWKASSIDLMMMINFSCIVIINTINK